MWSAGFHQAVSMKTFGWSGRTCHSHARSQIAAWARISRASGNSVASSTVFCPSAGIPRPAWIRIGTRRSCATSTISRTPGSCSVNCSARGCSLIPTAPASRQRRASAAGEIPRVEPAEGHQPPVGASAAAIDDVVGPRVAVRLVHREDDGARVRAGHRIDQLGGRLLHPVGVVAPDVGVGVEQVERPVRGLDAVPVGTEESVDVQHMGRGPYRRRAILGRCHSAASASASRPRVTRSRGRCSSRTRASVPA